MNQPRITARITFLAKSDGGRDVPPANVSSGQYRPHLVVNPNQLRGVTMDGVDGETYLGVTFARGPLEIIPGEPFIVELILMYWPNVKYDALIPGATFTIREGPHTVGYGSVESVLSDSSV